MLFTLFSVLFGVIYENVLYLRIAGRLRPLEPGNLKCRQVGIFPCGVFYVIYRTARSMLIYLDIWTGLSRRAPAGASGQILTVSSWPPKLHYELKSGQNCRKSDVICATFRQKRCSEHASKGKTGAFRLKKGSFIYAVLRHLCSFTFFSCRPG